jgi:hypothetical protein
MSSWHCIRLRACETEISAAKKKLRTVTGAVICRKDFALIHDRGMSGTKPKARGEHEAPHLAMPGVPVKRTLCQIPVLCRLEPGLIIVELRAGSGHHFSDRLLSKRALWIRRWPAGESIMLFSVSLL